MDSLQQPSEPNDPINHLDCPYSHPALPTPQYEDQESGHKSDTPSDSSSNSGPYAEPSFVQNEVPPNVSNEFHDKHSIRKHRRPRADFQVEKPLTAAEIQSKIRQITRDTSLSEEQKNKARQDVLSQPFMRKRRREKFEFTARMNKRARQRSYSNVKDKNGNFMLGCEHYPRNCKIQAACCGMWVVCRLCHDAACMDHSIDRKKTKRVMCMHCFEEQDVAKSCRKCGLQFAEYFCEKCKFYDNTPGKDIYHCDKCTICRVGKGDENFHCDNCDACVSKEFADSHRCLKKSLDANCPICGDYLFTSTKPVVFMKCGHTMHAKCFDVYTVDNFICPLCHKSLTDMTSYYARIDEIVKRDVMPEEHRHKVAEILCQDCDRRSRTPYHFHYLKCQIPNCGSYNTRLIHVTPKNCGEGSSSQAGPSNLRSPPPEDDEEMRPAQEDDSNSPSDS